MELLLQRQTSHYKVVYDLSTGTISNDFNDPITQLLRSRQYSMLNISVMVEVRDIFTMEDE